MSKGTEEGSAVRQGLWSTIQAKSRKCLFHITCSPVLFRIGVPSSSSNLIDPFQSKIVKDVISGSLLPTILFLVEDQVGVGVCWHSCTVCFALDRVLAGIHIPSLPSLAFLTPPPLPPYWTPPTSHPPFSFGCSPATASKHPALFTRPHTLSPLHITVLNSSVCSTCIPVQCERHGSSFRSLWHISDGWCGRHEGRRLLKF